MRYSFLFVLPALAACGPAAPVELTPPDLAPPVLPRCGDGPLAEVKGRAHLFGPAGKLEIGGAVITAVECPEHNTTVAADGAFVLRVPSRGEASFILEKPGLHAMQTAAHPIPETGINQLGFQVPAEAIFNIMASLAQIDPNPDRCQLVTTVTAAGTEIKQPFGGSGLGEPDALVQITPALPPEHGPVYFAYLNEILIAPDPTLKATTLDGGVIFANVPPGDYVMRAEKPGKRFTTVKMRCRAGILVNAAPPMGIQGI